MMGQLLMLAVSTKGMMVHPKQLLLTATSYSLGRRTTPIPINKETTPFAEHRVQLAYQQAGFLPGVVRVRHDNIVLGTQQTVYGVV